MAANSGALIAGLLAAGNTIFLATSWLRTSLLTNEWPQASNPPATTRIAVRARPANTISASNVLLRMSMPPSICCRAIRGSGGKSIYLAGISIRPAGGRRSEACVRQPGDLGHQAGVPTCPGWRDVRSHRWTCSTGGSRPVATADPQRLLPGMKLDELLDELRIRLQAVLSTRDRVHSLLAAVVSVGSSLELEVLLRRIVETAVELVDARFGAMGVIGDGDRLAEFIPVGLSDGQIAEISHWPAGKGLLGLLINDPSPLRLADISEHPASFGFPTGHPPMKSFLGAPIRIRGEVYGNLYLTEKEGGGQFDAEDESVLIALAAAAGVAIENARLYEEARRQQRWLRATTEVTSRLLSGAEPGDALAMITEMALEMTGSDLVVVALPVGDGSTLQIEHAAGEGAKEAQDLVLPTKDSASGLVLSSGERLTIADFRTGERTGSIGKKRMRLRPGVLVPLGGLGGVRRVLPAGRRPGSMPLS